MGTGACYSVGAGIADITPEHGLPYLAWRPRHQPFRSMHDRLFVRSVVITACGQTVVILSADAIGFNNNILGPGRNFTQEVRKRVSIGTGIPEENVMLTSSHIHSTPETIGFRPVHDNPAMMAWLETVIEKMAQCIESACENRFDATLKTASGSVHGISYNRSGLTTMDPQLTVLMFQEEEGEGNIVLVNYACHPVIMQVQESVSADFVGVIEHTIETAWAGNRACLFLQGACGDIDPVTASSRKFADAYSTGMAIAGESLKLLGTMSLPGWRAQPVLLKSTRRVLQLPSRPLPDAEEQRRTLQRYETLQRGCGQVGQDADELYAIEEDCFRIVEGGSPYEAELQAFRIGDMLLFGIPGEPLSELGLYMKQHAGPLSGVPIGYTNGYLGYIAPPEAWEQADCYETALGMWSKVGPEAFTIIQNSFRELKAELL